ncbi:MULTISPECIES: nicotinamide riboside transporter PnuC [unclassified Shewanella]|uniref:nicotinamide riboside transporter PnuC n=1 Tax=unclassified Shewanella TaxID=196818 RepID=UPI000C827F24|nr:MULTISPECIES: nicotinamide riboside transporter PnuC [unclassified Shewanella]MDO6618180.1 nicotinamide riboside transporter PnuC [Shewanella sp. 6_MG-2023]MDO6638452.1 nicotinamide riboside transporter PnuC [Shewanella sp. 5_MG-2023]MDO6677372.1 nicotinamide riboside transporter PnuC [Shewanella sp. 4_MG-2023]MDO6774275.1 nicotinamide riboside transporter PnuC [Shewanella sp. 3_MG-2023]PMG29271.1 nicotinamide mononucleotide transporter [Shewanella sp. 10N.286.52.C2]
MLSEIVQSIQIAITEVSVMTGWEAVAVILAIAYLILAMKTNIWCWAAAFASTAIYTVLFWNVSLLMESVLNVYYMAMAIYGFWLWRYGADSRHQTELPIISWSLNKHLVIIAVTSGVSLIVGYLMATNTSASFPYLDALTTCFAVMTTYLVAKKVIENWYYWMVINSLSIYLYLQKGLMLTSGLLILYLFMAVSGYFMWRKKMLQNHAPDDAALAS